MVKVAVGVLAVLGVVALVERITYLLVVAEAQVVIPPEEPAAPAS
jgi:hypothetical protein